MDLLMLNATMPKDQKHVGFNSASCCFELLRNYGHRVLRVISCTVTGYLLFVRLRETPSIAGSVLNTTIMQQSRIDTLARFKYVAVQQAIPVPASVPTG